MRILLVGYDPYEHGEEEFEELSKEEIEALNGDIWTREYDLTNPTFHKVECLVSDIQSWAEKGGQMYVKELGEITLSDVAPNNLKLMKRKSSKNDEVYEAFQNFAKGSRYQ